MKISDLDYKQRRQLAYKLYNNLFVDLGNQYQIIDEQTDQQLTDQVLDFFNNGSKLIYPAKFIFCNIVYSYYLNKYFKLDFYQCLDDQTILDDSPCVCLYSQRRNVYDNVLKQVLPKIETFDSIIKTRKFFKQEYLINDEDLSDVNPFYVK